MRLFFCFFAGPVLCVQDQDVCRSLRPFLWGPFGVAQSRERAPLRESREKTSQTSEKLVYTPTNNRESKETRRRRQGGRESTGKTHSPAVSRAGFNLKNARLAYWSPVVRSPTYLVRDIGARRWHILSQPGVVVGLQCRIRRPRTLDRHTLGLCVVAYSSSAKALAPGKRWSVAVLCAGCSARSVFKHYSR